MIYHILQWTPPLQPSEKRTRYFPYFFIWCCKSGCCYKFSDCLYVYFMFMLYNMSIGEKLKKVLMYVLSSQGQEISMLLYQCCNSAKHMFIISHKWKVKETADVSAVISKVSNLLFIFSFSVIAQNICLCLCPILCPIEGKWKKVLMYLISSPTCLHSTASRLHKGNPGLQVKKSTHQCTPSKRYSKMYSVERHCQGHYGPRG